MKLSQRENYSGASAMKPRFLTAVIYLTEDAMGYCTMDRENLIYSMIDI